MMPNPPVRGSRKRKMCGGKYVGKQKLSAMRVRKPTATAAAPFHAPNRGTDMSFQLRTFPARIAQKKNIMS